MTRILFILLPLFALAGCNPEPSADQQSTALPEICKVQPDTAGAPVDIMPGLSARILKGGYGRAAVPGDLAEVHYTGWLLDEGADDNRGSKFDSSVDRGQPFAFPLGGGRVIKGWDQGVQCMEIGEIRAYCLSLPGTTFDFPFDAETCVFRVGGKMFALVGINSEPPRVSLKCDPELSRDLRTAFEGIVPGYHMNKEHWNTVATRSDVPPEKVTWLIDHSYQLVLASLPKNRRPVSR